MSELTKSDKSILVRALMEFSGRSLDQVKKFAADKSARELLALRYSPKVRPIFDRLRSEKTAEAHGGSQYATDIIAVLWPHGEAGLARQHALELIEQERRSKGLTIPRTIVETIQHSFESYCLQSQVFLKRGTPCDALFRSRIVRNSAYWSVDREAAAHWLIERGLPLPWQQCAIHSAIT